MILEKAEKKEQVRGRNVARSKAETLVQFPGILLLLDIFQACGLVMAIKQGS